jgi:uncharacterized protein with HEPN domain
VAKHSPNQSLADALERIERAEAIVQRHGFETVRDDSTLVDALLHNLLIASEAVTRLKNEWPEKYAALETEYPDVNFYAFRRLGDVLRHAYGDVDLNIIERRLDGLIQDVKNAIQSELVLSRIELPPDDGG